MKKTKTKHTMKKNPSSLRRVGFWPAACLLLALTGCANVNSVYRPIYAAEGQGALIDVKQRAILVGKREVDGSGAAYTGNAPRQFIICAEPSPDAMSAYAGEFAGRLALSPVGEATGKSESLAIQGAMREAASFVGMRTPSVQLLRDAMYRVCEAYANGGIDDAQYELLMRRYQRHIVALAAIDQLTQAVRVPPITLTTAGNLGGGRPLDEWSEEIARQQGAQAKHQADADAQAEKTKAAETVIAEAKEALKEDAKDAAAQKKLKDGQEAQAKAAAAKKAADQQVKQTKDRILGLQAGMVAGSSLGGTTAAEAARTAGGSSSEHIAEVAWAVWDVTKDVLHTDDTPAMCFAYLSTHPKAVDSLAQMCTANVAVMKAAAELEIKRLEDCKADTSKCRPSVAEMPGASAIGNWPEVLRSLRQTMRLVAPRK